MRRSKLRAASIIALVAGAASPALAQYKLTTLVNFNGSNGSEPVSGLTLVGSLLYGTTSDGGPNLDGTVFSEPISGGAPTTLANFNGTNGEAPYDGLIVDGNNIYGTTSEGGNLSLNNGRGDGTVFSVPITGGTPTTLVNFNGSNGAGPQAGLSVSGTTLYGTTGDGGTNGDGTVFSVPISGGTPNTLVNFNGSNGSNPYAAVAVVGNILYGMTNTGGNLSLSNGNGQGAGTVFSLPITGGAPTTLATFNDSNGANPQADLIVVGNTLYGTTVIGGNLSVNGGLGYGTVFSVPITGGTPTTLATFNGSNGAFPYGGMTVVGNTLYGTTDSGGAHNNGTVFSVPIAGGGPTTLVSFNLNSDGAGPELCDLISDANGNLYGTTVIGGTGGAGTVFELFPPTWAKTNGGSWTTTGNWNAAGVPAMGGTACFGGSIASPSMVTLGGSVSVGTVIFNNSANSYTIASGSGGSLTLANASGTAAIIDNGGSHFITAPVILNSNTNVMVANSGDTLQISGNISGSGGLSMGGAGTLMLNGSNSYAGGTTISGGTLIANSNNSLPTNGAVVNNSTLIINGNNTTAAITGTGNLTVGTGTSNNTLQIAANTSQNSQGSISVATGSTLDITNNSIIINYTGSDPIAYYQGLVNNGYAGGSWTGTTSITSSTVAASVGDALTYGIAVADGGDGSGNTTLASSQLEITAALDGDCNLDGTVDSVDLGIVLANWQKTGMDWDEGDFNGDGTVDSTDLGLLLSNWQDTASLSVTELDALESLTGDSIVANPDGTGFQLVSVPEPGSISLLAIGSLGLLKRRRRVRL